MSETTADDLTRLLEAYLSEQPQRAVGGVRALSGFEYQLRSYLADFGQALAEDGTLHQGGERFANALEALSDHTRTDGDLTVCVQVKRTLRADSLADAAAEFAIVDTFLEGRIAAERYAEIRYECVGRSGEAVLDWTKVRLPAKVRSSHPDLQRRFEALRDVGRLLPSRVEPDPWWRLFAAVHVEVDDPLAFAREALDLVSAGTWMRTAPGACAMRFRSGSLHAAPESSHVVIT